MLVAVPSTMEPPVFGATEYNKVLSPVVIPLAIQVVNRVVLGEIRAQNLLHHKPMLWDVTRPIRARMRRSMDEHVTSGVDVSPRSLLAGWDVSRSFVVGVAKALCQVWRLAASNGADIVIRPFSAKRFGDHWVTVLGPPTVMQGAESLSVVFPAAISDGADPHTDAGLSLATSLARR